MANFSRYDMQRSRTPTPLRRDDSDRTQNKPLVGRGAVIILLRCDAAGAGQDDDSSSVLNLLVAILDKLRSISCSKN